MAKVTTLAQATALLAKGNVYLGGLQPSETEALFGVIIGAGGGVTTLTGSATLDFPSTAAGTSSDLTIAVAGAAVGNPVSVSAPVNAANSSYSAFVSSAGVVTVRFNNYSAGAIDPASGTYKVTVSKF